MVTSFLNELELIHLHTSIAIVSIHLNGFNNSIQYELFVCTQSNGSKYCNVSLTIQLDLVGLVSLFNGISTLFRLFNAKAILLEEQ